MSDVDSNNTKNKIHALPSGPVPELISLYLQEHNFDDQHHVTLVEFGAEVVDQLQAEQLIGRERDSLKEWEEFLWLPRREPDGKVIREQGQLLTFATFRDLLGPHLKRSRIAPNEQPAIPTTHLSFFGDGWYGYESEFTIDESWIKAALRHIVTGENCIGLQGVNTIRCTLDRQKQIVQHFDMPVWSPSAAANICFDSPDRTNPNSRQGLADAKASLVEILGPSIKEIYDASIPTPTDAKLSQDLNDFYGDHGEEAFNFLKRHRRILHTATAGEIIVTSATEIAEREPTLYIINEIVPANDVAMLVGKTSCGKTFLAMSIGLAVARPDVEDWMGQRILAHGPVVHLALEGAGLPYRLKAYCKHHEIERQALPNYYAIETPADLTSPDYVDRLITAINEAIPAPPVLIIVDTVNRALGGKDENSSGEMGALSQAADRLRCTYEDSCVVLVHHYGKNTSAGARGHSSLISNVGAEIVVTSDEASNLRDARITKMRDGEIGQRFYFTLGVENLGKNLHGDDITSCVIVPAEGPVDPVNPTDTEPMRIYRSVQDWWAGPHEENPLTASDIKNNHAEIVAKTKTKYGVNKCKEILKWAEKQGLETTVGNRNGGPVYTLRPIVEGWRPTEENEREGRIKY